MAASAATWEVLRNPPPGAEGPSAKGNMAKKPYSGAVLTIRTRPPASVRLSRHRMSTPSISRLRLRGWATVSSAMGWVPLGSRTQNEPTAPPMATRTRDSTSAPYKLRPSGPIASAAMPDPSVGSPTVKTNQNQPATEPPMLSLLVTWAQTRNENANNG